MTNISAEASLGFCFYDIDGNPIPGLCPSFDFDGDGIASGEDMCLDTEGEQIVYGCSCKQILELKPGEDNNGKCSQGIINVFTEKIGWAENLFN